MMSNATKSGIVVPPEPKIYTTADLNRMKSFGLFRQADFAAESARGLKRGNGFRTGMIEINRGKSEDVILCDYITTDGNAYIDTGYRPTTRIGFDLRYAISSFTRHVVFAGLNDASSSDNFINLTCYWGSVHADRRFCYHVGIGLNAFWEYSANSSNRYFDGVYHDIKVPYNSVTSSSLWRTTNITVDEVNFNTVSNIGSTANSLPINNITVFAAIGTTGNKYYQAPNNIGLKLNRIVFYNSSNVMERDFRAARKNEEYGLYDVVTETFYGGINGTILGA